MQLCVFHTQYTHRQQQNFSRATILFIINIFITVIHTINFTVPRTLDFWPKLNEQASNLKSDRMTTGIMTGKMETWLERLGVVVVEVE